MGRGWGAVAEQMRGGGGGGTRLRARALEAEELWLARGTVRSKQRRERSAQLRLRGAHIVGLGEQAAPHIGGAACAAGARHGRDGIRTERAWHGAARSSPLRGKISRESHDDDEEAVARRRGEARSGVGSGEDVTVRSGEVNGSCDGESIVDADAGLDAAPAAMSERVAASSAGDNTCVPRWAVASLASAPGRIANSRDK